VSRACRSAACGGNITRRLAAGVTLWEIFANAEEPYSGMANDVEVGVFVCRGGRLGVPRCTRPPPPPRPGTCATTCYVMLASLLSAALFSPTSTRCTSLAHPPGLLDVSGHACRGGMEDGVVQSVFACRTGAAVSEDAEE
jgi:hypothetical protein